MKHRAIRQMLAPPKEIGNLFGILKRIADSELLNEEMNDLTNNILIPILNTPPLQIESTFDTYILSFKSKFKEIIEIIRESQEWNNEAEDYDVDMERFSKDFTASTEFHLQDRPEISKRISHTIAVLFNYSKTLLSNDNSSPDALENVLLYKINLDDLEKYISGSMLAFLCILSLIHKESKDLHIFLSISDKYTRLLSSYVKVIDVLCNYSKIQEIKPLIHTNPIVAEVIGKSLVKELPLEYKSQHNGEFVAISYNDGSIIAESNSLKELHDRIDEKGIRDDYYIYRIGYDYIAKIGN